MAHACSKVAMGICSSPPFTMPVSLRCTTPALASIPVRTTKWFAAVRCPGRFQMVSALSKIIAFRPAARSCSNALVVVWTLWAWIP